MRSRTRKGVRLVVLDYHNVMVMVGVFACMFTRSSSKAGQKNMMGPCSAGSHSRERRVEVVGGRIVHLYLYK
jgi:hypothetical protein